MEEIITTIVLIAGAIIAVFSVVSIVVGSICMIRETIREHNNSKPEKKLSQSEIIHLYAQLKYYKSLVEYYREKIDKIRREK